MFGTFNKLPPKISMRLQKKERSFWKMEFQKSCNIQGYRSWSAAQGHIQPWFSCLEPVITKNGKNISQVSKVWWNFEGAVSTPLAQKHLLHFKCNRSTKEGSLLVILLFRMHHTWKLEWLLYSKKKKIYFATQYIFCGDIPLFLPLSLVYF